MTPAWLPYLDGRAQPEALSIRAALALLGSLGQLYGAAVTLRRRAYQRGWLESYRAPCPVLSVGNLVSGGTGKTPVVRWLAGRLQAAGRRAAIVSRGYGQPGASRETPLLVADAAGVRTDRAADEPLLLARALPGVAVVTCPRRQRAIELAVHALGCDVVVLDDGFQHLAVQRDLDIVLLDATRPFGNGRLLPGGVLRDPPAALARAGLVIWTRADHPPPALALPCPSVRARHAPAPWRPPAAGPAWGFCGLAQPDSFRATLGEAGIPLAGFTPFPDHHPYTESDLAALGRRAAEAGATHLVCTDKDQVKLDPRWSPLPIQSLGMSIQFQGEGEAAAWQVVERALQRAS